MSKRFKNGIKRKKFSAIAEIKKLDSILSTPKNGTFDSSVMDDDIAMSLLDAVDLSIDLQNKGAWQFCDTPSFLSHSITSPFDEVAS